MAKLDHRFLDVLLRDMPYSEDSTLSDVLATIAGGSTEYGFWLTYTSSRTITVHSGRIDIFGALHTLDVNTVIDIYDDFGDAGSPLVNTVYHVYAADENDELNFYFSAVVPTRPGQADTYMDILRRHVPLQHPAHDNWRYIGQVLFRNDATILPFAACTPTYWEGSWNSVSGSNTDIILGHGWGEPPQDICFFFNTTAALTNLPLATPYTGIGSKLYGVLPSDVSDKSITVRTAKDGTFWNSVTRTWARTGYVKAVIRR